MLFLKVCAMFLGSRWKSAWGQGREFEKDFIEMNNLSWK